jgi:hypothetical protein
MLIGVQLWFACASVRILMGGGSADDVAEGYFLEDHSRRTSVSANTWKVAKILGRVHAFASALLFGSLIVGAIAAFKKWQWNQSGADYTNAVAVSIALGLVCAVAADLVRPSP